MGRRRRREECYQRTTLRTTRLHLPNIAPWILQGERETFPLFFLFFFFWTAYHKAVFRSILRWTFGKLQRGDPQSNMVSAINTASPWTITRSEKKKKINLSNFNVSLALLLHKHMPISEKHQMNAFYLYFEDMAIGTSTSFSLQSQCFQDSNKTGPPRMQQATRGIPE